MDLLIDGDIIAYRSAAACDGRQYTIGYIAPAQPERIFIVEKYKKDADAIAKSLENEGNLFVDVSVDYEPEPLEHATFLMGKAIGSIVKNCTDHYGVVGKVRIFLSRGGSFREKEFPAYKSNRKEIRRPAHLEALKDLLEKSHGAECKRGLYEADDMMAFNQNTEEDSTVICTIDKDLLQVPGNHYHLVKKTFRVIQPEEGNRLLYQQMLTGDATDGIPGIKGIGPKTAEKLLKGVHSPFMMYCTVLKTYLKHMPQEEEESLETYQERIVHTVRAHARLLYLLRTPDDSWEAPIQEES
jgi:hypothetical protein